MRTTALIMVATSLGWLVTLCLAHDLRRLKVADFAIAIAGALAAAWLLPRCGLEVWGESGLRLSSLLAMGAGSFGTLWGVELARDRSGRASILLGSLDA